MQTTLYEESLILSILDNLVSEAKRTHRLVLVIQ